MPVVITMGCTAGSLTACRLRTFVIRYFYRTTIFSIYIFTDFTNLYFHIYYISNTLSILKKYFPKRRKAAYYRYLALPQSFIINFFSKLDLLKKMFRFKKHHLENLLQLAYLKNRILILSNLPEERFGHLRKLEPYLNRH